MTIQFYLFICCTGGGITGGFFRWYYPNIFKVKEKREIFTELNLVPSLIIGALIGFGVAIFFRSDLVHIDQVYTAYIEKLGLMSFIITLSVIDRLDEHLIKKVSSFLDSNT